MKTKEELERFKNECRDRVIIIREQVRNREIDKALGKSREQREFNEIEYLDSIIALIDCGYTESKLAEWRLQLEEKINLIKQRNPEPSEFDTDDTLKKKIQEHEKAHSKAKLVSQIRNIDFILN